MLGQKALTYLKFLIHTVKMSSWKRGPILSLPAIYRSDYFTTSSITLDITSFPNLCDLTCISYFKFISSDSFQHTLACLSPFWVLMSTTKHRNPGVIWPIQSKNGLSPTLSEHKIYKNAAQDCFCFTGSWLVFNNPSVLCSHALQINLAFPIMYL